MLRTFAFMVAGALVFKLLLRRVLLLGALAGFLVELARVGAAVMNWRRWPAQRDSNPRPPA